MLFAWSFSMRRIGDASFHPEFPSIRRTPPPHAIQLTYKIHLNRRFTCLIGVTIRFSARYYQGLERGGRGSAPAARGCAVRRRCRGGPASCAAGWLWCGSSSSSRSYESCRDEAPGYGPDRACVRTRVGRNIPLVKRQAKHPVPGEVVKTT